MSSLVCLPQTLVYATVSEQLNSSGWQERLAACTVLPMLHGPVTKVGGGKGATRSSVSCHVPCGRHTLTFRQCLHDGVTRITYVVVDHPLPDCRWTCLSPPVHSGGVGGGGDAMQRSTCTLSSTCWSTLCVVSQDVCDKLVVLMWKDWSPEVRDIAAEALGKLGKGKVRRRH